MNKPIVMAIAALAVLVSSTTAMLQVSNAQYFGGGGEAVTEDNLKECESYGIERANCNETTILAARKVGAANQNPATGSGTPYFLGNETFAVIGILGAIFGGVAAMFFFKGRGSKQVPS